MGGNGGEPMSSLGTLTNKKNDSQNNAFVAHLMNLLESVIVSVVEDVLEMVIVLSPHFETTRLYIAHKY